MEKKERPHLWMKDFNPMCPVSTPTRQITEIDAIGEFPAESCDSHLQSEF
jgi:hypothetical protein